MSQERVARCITIDIPCNGNVTHHLTPLSDLHMENAVFPDKAFHKFMTERNALFPNHRAIIIGDVVDMVVPVDQKRFRNSVSRPTTRDDWANEAVERATDTLQKTGTKIDVICPGNHEDEFLKRHGYDATSVLAFNLKAIRGGYSGYIRYRIKQEGTNRTLGTPLILAYHHGAWGGRVIKGFSGARDWFRGFQGWHMALFGHNHQVTVLPERHHRVLASGRMIRYPAYYVCTGSWSESYDTADGRNTHYAERAGYMPTIQTTPLIRFGAYKRDSNWQLEYSVEV